jgi:hypothetical protein
MNIVQIVPALPPSISGVGDYALLLAKELSRSYGVISRLLVGNPHWNGRQTVDEFHVEKVSSASSRALQAAIRENSAETIVLHYVGYGYSRRGCPFWLVEGLERQLAGKPHRLITIFHEISAFGAPWTSAFWLSKTQRTLAERLLHISDSCITTNGVYGRILESMNRKSVRVFLRPVFSNVGEPENLDPLEKRSRRLAIFGSAVNRARIYKNHASAIRLICEEFDLNAICDIGEPVAETPLRVGLIPVSSCKETSAEHISRVLSGSIAGALDHDHALLSKSGVFAAYCSHKLTAINLRRSSRSPHKTADELQTGRHYWVPGLNCSNFQSIADSGHEWYQSHSVCAHASLVTDLLSRNS